MREADRRALPGIPDRRIECVSQLPELLRVAAARLPKAQSLASRLMYEGKAKFDRAVAARLAASASDVVVGQYGSAAETLSIARQTGRLGVLNFVSSHPQYRNQYLREMAGLTEGHHELVSARTAAAIQAEIDSADLILVPSRFVARQLQELGVSDDKIALEPYGVDLSAFRPAEDETTGSRSQLPLVCLYVGQISYRKGIRVLIEAARRLPASKCQFTLIGPLVSPDVLKDLPENCKWLGASVHGEVAAAMRHADIFILPSIDDAYPLVTLEAMASGLAVIVSDHAGTNELITDGEDGLVVPAGDPDAIVRALERLMQTDGLVKDTGQAARRTVSKGNSWDEYGARVLTRLTGNPPASNGSLRKES
ncbi:MAG: glycosyltransferase family 4 protein [Dehalococcoidia bacterium]